MSYRILTKNAVENTNIDGARDHNFNAGRRSGIVQGALNSGNLFLSANNTIALDTCELRLCGHRVVIDSAEYKTFYNQPSVPIRYSLVAQIIVSNNGESVSFDLKTQSSTTPLVQNDLDKNINGTYELEIGRFTQLTDGTLTDVVRTADLITGGGNNDSEYIRIGTVTTNKISPELDADVDIENTINPDDNKPQTNFTFNLPTSVGTVVSVNGEEKTSINTDITPIASSENLITSGGVHDYPAVTFAESERQKSKNLFNATTAETTDGYSITYSADTSELKINGAYTDGARCMFNTWSLKKGTYTLCIKFVSGSMTRFYAIRFMLYKGKSWTQYASCPDISSSNRQVYVTFTLTEDVYDARLGLYENLNTNTMTDCVFKYQIVAGSVPDFDFQPYSGPIVHEKEIADVEHIELIYDKTSSDANINKGLTSGIPFDNTTELNLGANLSNKYKGTYVYITIWNVQLRIYCDISYGQARYAFAGSDPNSAAQSIIIGVVSINNATGILKGNSLKIANLGSGGGYTTLTDSKYNIYKVEGVLK